MLIRQIGQANSLAEVTSQISLSNASSSNVSRFGLQHASVYADYDSDDEEDNTDDDETRDTDPNGVFDDADVNHKGAMTLTLHSGDTIDNDLLKTEDESQMSTDI